MLLPHWLVILAVLCTLVSSSSSSSINSFSVADPVKSRFALRQLMNWYLAGSGRWLGHLSYAPDWCRANAVEALANYYLYLTEEQSSEEEKNYLWQTLRETQKAQGERFYQQAEYFDDILWWSLAYTRVYEVALKRGELAAAEELLQVAKGINDVVTTDSWETTQCGGGAYWSRTSKYKNAITNELYFTSSARLARLTSNETFAQRASVTLEWILNSGMLRNDTSLIVDGLDSSCNPTGGVYTYNQGVILGGISEYTQINPSNYSLIEIGEQITNAVSLKLVDADSGVLTEVSCGDGALFKGIYARYVRYFIQMSKPKSSSSLESFLQVQSNSVWNHDRDVLDGYFGKSWLGPYDYNLHNLQISALELLDATSSTGQYHQSIGVDCGEHGWLTSDNSCVCFARYSGERCEKEFQSWSEYFQVPRNITLSSGRQGTVLCGLNPTSNNPDFQSIVSCSSDSTMELSYFTVEMIPTSNRIVRIRTASGFYLSARQDPAVVAIKVANSDLDTLVDIQFIASTVLPQSNDDSFGLVNPLQVEFVSFQSVSSLKLLSVSGMHGAVELIEAADGSTLFQTNFEQGCK